MEKELNEAATRGLRFSKVMGGKATDGGQVIIAMAKAPAFPGEANPTYRLLATTRTSTMQAEMQQLADEGYSWLDQSVFESATGGKDIAVIMELDPSRNPPPHDSYRLLATTRTSTMEKELKDAGAQGYHLLAFTAGKTASGHEIIAILRRNFGER